jgi:HAD superfamily hydrolase (TIGR01450 family)
MRRALSDIQCFLLDMDGTFYLDEHLIEGALEFIEVIRSQGKEYIFLTNNSSRHRGYYAKKISRMGLAVPEKRIFTSGEATALFLKRKSPGARIYVVGTKFLEDEFRQHGFILDEQKPEMVVLGFDTTLTYHKLWRLCDLVRAGLPYLATHPDLNCPTKGGFMPDIGAMIAFVQTSTGRLPDQVIGKPNRTIIDELSNRLHVPLEQLAMIGDRLYTDIALGETTGITTILVLSGETQPADLETSPFKPDYVFNHIGEVAHYLKSTV